MKLLSKIKTIFSILGAIAVGIFTIFAFRTKDQPVIIDVEKEKERIKQESDNKKKDIELTKDKSVEDIKNTSTEDIVKEPEIKEIVDKNTSETVSSIMDEIKKRGKVT